MLESSVHRCVVVSTQKVEVPFWFLWKSGSRWPWFSRALKHVLKSFAESGPKSCTLVSSSVQVVPCGTFLSALSCLILNDSSTVRVLFDLIVIFGQLLSSFLIWGRFLGHFSNTCAWKEATAYDRCVFSFYMFRQKCDEIFGKVFKWLTPHWGIIFCILWDRVKLKILTFSM